MHQKVFDYIHVAERQEFQSQLHWVMNPGQQDNDEDVVMGHMYSSEEPDGVPPELSPFLTRCFIARVRCLLDSTSGFLVNEGKADKAEGQKRALRVQVNTGFDCSMDFISLCSTPIFSFL
ncbi:aryl hydrocarbon receptor repressor-like isoform X2 [Chanodichthys erythropterus]|uniref:aryl hydrocarbon receptor repressor-like isoform X2 n=1 Tax=Chanodichthys erythropterus TaxID=933992 RepID=UPI00351F2421